MSPNSLNAQQTASAVRHLYAPKPRSGLEAGPDAEAEPLGIIIARLQEGIGDVNPQRAERRFPDDAGAHGSAESCRVENSAGVGIGIAIRGAKPLTLGDTLFRRLEYGAEIGKYRA